MSIAADRNPADDPGAEAISYELFRQSYQQRTKPWDDLSPREQLGWRRFAVRFTAEAAASERERIRAKLAGLALYRVFAEDLHAGGKRQAMAFDLLFADAAGVRGRGAADSDGAS
jgi:hypothetical protein